MFRCSLSASRTTGETTDQHRTDTEHTGTFFFGPSGWPLLGPLGGLLRASLHCANSWNVGRCLPKSAPPWSNLPKSGRTWFDEIRGRPVDSGPIRPLVPKFGTNSTQLGEHGPESSNLDQIRPILTLPECGQIWSELLRHQNWPRTGQTLPSSGQIWPGFGQPKSVKLDRQRSGHGQHCTTSGTMSANLGRLVEAEAWGSSNVD